MRNLQAYGSHLTEDEPIKRALNLIAEMKEVHRPPVGDIKISKSGSPILEPFSKEWIELMRIDFETWEKVKEIVIEAGNKGERADWLTLALFGLREESEWRG